MQAGTIVSEGVVSPMHATLSRSWGLVLLRGIIAALFGIAALVLPGLTALTLVTFIGAFALVDGVFALIAAFRLGSQDDRWWALIFEGAVGILFGLVAFFDPAAILGGMVYLVAAWAVITGVLEIVSAIRLRKVIDNEFWLAVSGVFSILFGILLFAWPASAVIAWAWVIGFYALLYGASLIALALRLRSHQPRLPDMTQRTV